MGNSHSSRKSSRNKISKKKSLQKLNNSESTKQQQTYDPSSKFHIPKNNNDIDRMQQEHFLFQHIWQCNFSSPIEQTLKAGNAKVLDVGCGPGVWLLSTSLEYPLTQFYGIDIAPVFPKEIKPENLEFIQSDITNGIRFDDNYFDFVRMNLLSTSLQENQWVYVIEELVRVLKPGGYIEIMEPEFQFYNIGPYFSKLNSCLINFISSTGANVHITQKIESFLNTSNSQTSSQTDVNLCNILSKLTEIHSDTRTIPIGGVHGGKIGTIYEELLTMYFKNTVVDILPWYIGTSRENYLELWKLCQEEFKNYASFTNLVRFWGKKVAE
ncbi:35284_t:CDS:2 [Gigaspora margarita]|uniref:35284_t:CDS:1 n=2 Tax=Gigaspora margarita TaxID=4874 RepID=A0ABN7VRY1_GIGMA|nr:S-adenosyl-L-methionine-dependent methyltransferase [Gigaspora margarita]CAG8795917.1 35284_t:CDS:2 [Gigaspora margarita]